MPSRQGEPQVLQYPGCRGDVSGSRFPNRKVSATKPCSLLDPTWFEVDSWSDISGGRWKFADSVVLGESRAVNKMLGIISNFRSSRGHKLISLQDNKPVSGASTKGRSSSFPLNRTLRKRASLALACALRILMPWVESARQPADRLSRWLELLKLRHLPQTQGR